MGKEHPRKNRLCTPGDRDLRKLRKVVREQLTDVKNEGNRHSSHAGLVPGVGGGVEALCAVALVIRGWESHFSRTSAQPMSLKSSCLVW